MHTLPSQSRSLSVQGFVRRKIINAATGEVAFDSGWAKNLILDNFFSNLTRSVNAGTATGTGNIAAQITGQGVPAGQNIKAGTGSTNPLRFDSTPTTLSQSGTTVTASGAFFTAGMVGMLLVFGGSGTGTNPCYITAFTSSTQVTVSTTATVGAVVGTVYPVAWLGISGTTITSTGFVSGGTNNFTSYAAGVLTYQVTEQFAVQVSPITILQIELFGQNTSGSSVGIAGFQVPGAGDTVPTGFFYQVAWQFQMTVTPSAPTAAPNVGTGLNTAGNIMCESLANFGTISSTGTVSAIVGYPLDGYPASNGTGSVEGVLLSSGVTLTQNAAIAAAGSEPVVSALTGYTTSSFTPSASAPANTGTAVLNGVWSFNTTGNGTVVGAIGIFGSSTRRAYLDLALTSTYASPGSGGFTFSFTFTSTIGRTVVN